MKILDIYDIKRINCNQEESSIEYSDSEKYFSINDNQLFKPLFKSKPYVTPLFAYSEVFWSYYINKYFENDSPRSFLAKNNSKGKSEYYQYGTVTYKVTQDHEKLVSLLEYFKENPDSKVDISNFEIPCNILYSYKEILESKIFHERDDLRHQLEIQILLSILKKDENFNYKNVSFIIENQKVKRLCPSLNSEYSLMFMYPDKEIRKETISFWRRRALYVPFDKIKCITIGNIWEDEDTIYDVSLNNILKIVSLDSEIVRDFIDRLDLFIEDIENTDLLFYNKDFFNTLSSDNWEIENARHNKNDEKLVLKLENNIKCITLDEVKFNNTLKQECLDSAKDLKFNLQVLLFLKDNDCLDEVSIKNCLELKNIHITKEEFNKLSLDDKLKLLEKQKVKSI